MVSHTYGGRCLFISILIYMTYIKNQEQATSLQIFKFNGNAVSFNTSNGVMINATQMAKQFNTRPEKWLRLDQAKELIACLSAKAQIRALDLVKVKKGGNQSGTWLHEDLALVFAQWLSAEFYLWCNDRVKELLISGSNAALTVGKVINGVLPIIYNGEVLYNVRELYKTFGLSSRTNVSCRKRRHPQHFKQLHGRLFMSCELATVLNSYYGYKQLSLNLK